MKIALLALALAAPGCQKRARYVDPDALSKVEGTGLESRDIRAVAAQMTQELLASPALAQFKGVPRIAVLPVENRTRFLIDQDLVTTLFTDQVINGAVGRVAVVNRDLLDTIMAERARKRAGEVDSQGSSALAGVDWFLEGEMRALSATDSKDQTDYVVVRFQATSAESGLVLWSNSWEVKKEGGWGVMYQ